MRYHVFATDYDGTLANNEHVSTTVIDALKLLKSSGRKIVLVTGRIMSELIRVFPEYQIFDRIVAENGAVIYNPATLEERLLGVLPPSSLIHKLTKLKGANIAIGKVIVATWEPYQSDVLNAIKESGLEYQVIFNKGAVMILPPGVNKAVGLHNALKEMSLSEHNTVVVGDAENDSAMFQAAECAVAVNNALSQVKDIADWTTSENDSLGVLELIKRLLDEDLRNLDHQLSRHYLTLGTSVDGAAFQISPFAHTVLLAGTSGCGKTTFAAAFIEKLIEKHYQFCLIDPEGDYLELDGSVSIGDSNQPPVIADIVQLLTHSTQNLVVCILAIELKERPTFFSKFYTAVTGVRNVTGRPHYLIIDEAHHLIPTTAKYDFTHSNEDLKNFMIITTKPELINHSFLSMINTTITMGDSPGGVMHSFSEIVNEQIDLPLLDAHFDNKMLVWQQGNNNTQVVKSIEPSKFLQRHKRKYATGDMANNSFFFTGPDKKYNIKANNLMAFIEIGKKIDDDTWLFHLLRKDFINWFRYGVNDELLASKTEKITRQDLDATASRKNIFALILDRYTSSA